MNGMNGGNSGGDRGGFVSLDALDEEGDGGNAYGGNGAYVEERVIIIFRIFTLKHEKFHTETCET